MSMPGIANDAYPCPCDACDGETLDPDAHCVECMHHGCDYEPKCMDINH